MMTMMRLDKIRILPAFRATPPRPCKVEAKLAFYKTHGRYDRDLLVDRHGWLLDGYATYLVMKANGEKDARVSVADRIAPTMRCIGGDGDAFWCGVSPWMARRAYTGRHVLLFLRGRFLTAVVSQVDLFSSRACWPAQGFLLPGAHRKGAEA